MMWQSYSELKGRKTMKVQKLENSGIFAKHDNFATAQNIFGEQSENKWEVILLKMLEDPADQSENFYII